MLPNFLPLSLQIKKELEGTIFTSSTKQVSHITTADRFLEEKTDLLPYREAN